MRSIREPFKNVSGKRGGGGEGFPGPVSVCVLHMDERSGETNA